MISIRLALQAGAAPAAPLIAQFGDGGGEIGRALDCTLVLPDPERRISRKHLQVSWRNGRHLLRLLSTNLLVELDGVALVPGVEFELHTGAQIAIGPFVLVVENARTAAAAASAVAAAADDRGAQERPSAQTPEAGVTTANDGAGLADDGAARSSDGAARSHDGAAAPWAAHDAAAKPSVFRDLLSVAPVERRASPRVPFDSRAHELDLVLGGNTDVAAVPRPPSADEMVEALYRGLGIAAPPAEQRSAAQMVLAGALLRASVGGALRLLAARGVAKRELGAGATLIQTRKNNPLKFAADADAALKLLLEPPQRGFIPSLQAVAETYDDLQAHEVAMLAGMRAALEAVLQRFDPAALERGTLADKGGWDKGGWDKGVWDNLLPAHRKAKLWERFVEQHAQAAGNIADNSDALYAGAFSAAYEEQLARLGKG